MNRVGVTASGVETATQLANCVRSNASMGKDIFSKPVSAGGRHHCRSNAVVWGREQTVVLSLPI